MIIGIGTDICDISRIESLISKFGQKFIDKTFTVHEQEYCSSKSDCAPFYAKRFAAKEAVAKALATSSSGALSWLLKLLMIPQEDHKPFFTAEH